ncbi:MAG: YheC/YheD family protein [bacterium]
MRLGPVIGVFVGRGYLKNIEEGGSHFRLMGLVEGNRRAHTLLYLFSLRDINWPRGRIAGTYYNYEENRWKQHLFPFPDVLYDRAGGFSGEAEKNARGLRRRLQGIPGLKKINCQHYFDKWRLYQALHKHGDVREHLPQTSLYNRQNIEKMLQDYKVIYIKTCTGSNGRGVIRMARETIGYTLAYFAQAQVEKRIVSLSHLEEEIRKIIGNSRAIVQQGLDLVTHNGAIIDLRPLVQKNGKGEWQVTAIPVRMAVGGAHITSTRTGSRVYDFPYFFEVMAGYSKTQSQDLQARITELLRRIVARLEEEFGPFGELGIDLALDKEGKLWFIEANAKPGKDTVALGCGEETFIASFLNPLEYAKLLAGFKTAPLTGGTPLSSPVQVGWGRKSIIFSAGSVPSHKGVGTTVTAVEAIPVAVR